MKAAARLMLVAALTVSVGLHWAAMQSVAWVSMAVTYSVEKGSVMQGLSDTFDGQHACALCHAVQEGSQKSSPQDDPTPLKKGKDFKLHLAVTPVPQVVFHAPTSFRWIMTSETGRARATAPDPGPPRGQA